MIKFRVSRCFVPHVPKYLTTVKHLRLPLKWLVKEAYQEPINGSWHTYFCIMNNKGDKSLRKLWCSVCGGVKQYNF